MKNLKNQEQIEAIKQLKKMLNAKGVKRNTIYHTLRHVSSSGMSRQINFYIGGKEGIRNINWLIEKATHYKRDRKTDAIKVSGCGMDMGFAVVYDIGRTLYPNGFKLAKGQYGRNGDKSGFDKDGGYKFKSVWM